MLIKWLVYICVIVLPSFLATSCTCHSILVFCSRYQSWHFHIFYADGGDLEVFLLHVGLVSDVLEHFWITWGMFVYRMICLFLCEQSLSGLYVYIKYIIYFSYIKYVLCLTNNIMTFISQNFFVGSFITANSSWLWRLDRYFSFVLVWYIS